MYTPIEVVKVFNEKNLHTEIVIKGTYEKILFRANNISELLGQRNIMSHIWHFDKSEKVVNSIDTLGGKST